jgi:hypothetical protein
MSASGVRWTIMLSPFVLVAFFSLILALPPSREAAQWLLSENRPVEVATFFLLLAAGLLSWRLAWRHHRRGQGLLAPAFFGLFGLGLVLVAFEEIAWGQYWLGFESPALLEEANAKGETTFHNLRGLDGRTEILRVLYGVGGLVGVWLNHTGRLRDITPAPVLTSWFAIIAVVSLYDFANDYASLIGPLNALAHNIDELIEMMIGVSALLFVWLKLRQPSEEVPPERAAGAAIE